MGYIYKIDCGDDDIYVGSTTNMHKRLLRHIKDTKTSPSKLYNKIRENNVIIKMEVLKVCPEVNDKRDLEKLEQEFIDKLKPTLNSQQAYLTDEKRKEYAKLLQRKIRANGGEEYRQKERERHRKYRENNREKIKAKKPEYDRKYRENNREKISAKKKATAQETVVCECGISITRGCLSKHKKRATHLDRMRSNLI